jgi:hypothetical protein
MGCRTTTGTPAAHAGNVLRVTLEPLAACRVRLVDQGNTAIAGASVSVQQAFWDEPVHWLHDVFARLSEGERARCTQVLGPVRVDPSQAETSVELRLRDARQPAHR